MMIPLRWLPPHFFPSQIRNPFICCLSMTYFHHSITAKPKESKNIHGKTGWNKIKKAKIFSSSETEHSFRRLRASSMPVYILLERKLKDSCFQNACVQKKFSCNIRDMKGYHYLKSREKIVKSFIMKPKNKDMRNPLVMLCIYKCGATDSFLLTNRHENITKINCNATPLCLYIFYAHMY